MNKTYEYKIEKDKNICGDLFLEIEAIISYFLIEFKPNNELYMQYDFDYHKKTSLFLYMFTIFDKFSTLIFFHNSTNYKDKEYNEIISLINFNKVDSYINLNNYNGEIFKRELKDLSSSKVMKLIKKIRNILTHRFECPMYRYHLSTNIMICFISICKLIDITINNRLYFHK